MLCFLSYADDVLGRDPAQCLKPQPSPLVAISIGFEPILQFGLLLLDRVQRLGLLRRFRVALREVGCLTIKNFAAFGDQTAQPLQAILTAPQSILVAVDAGAPLIGALVAFGKVFRPAIQVLAAFRDQTAQAFQAIPTARQMVFLAIEAVELPAGGIVYFSLQMFDLLALRFEIGLRAFDGSVLPGRLRVDL